MGRSKLETKWLSHKKAKEYITEYHRHHKPPPGAILYLGVWLDGELRGVGCLARPVSRHEQSGGAFEVTRIATDGVKNGCSKLYGAFARIAKELGAKSVITYTLECEGGASLRASGWQNEGEAGGGSWSRPSRGRIDKHPLEKKTKWRRTF